MPDNDDPQALPDHDCTGAHDCAASSHIDGCYANDRSGAVDGGDPAGDQHGPIERAYANVGFGFATILAIIDQYPELKHGFSLTTDGGDVHGFYEPLALNLDARSHWGTDSP